MATIKQKNAIENIVENRGNVSKGMRDAGYADKTVKNPSNLTESKAWEEIMEDVLPDENLAEIHRQQLNSTRIDHMVFPLGPKGEDDDNFSGAKPDKDKETKNEIEVERTTLTDEEIIDMLAAVNCTVKRIVHGQTARHVYFWSPDNMARDKALDKAYKLKGHYKAEKKELSGSINLADTIDD